MSSRFNIDVEDARIKRTLGPLSIKMYDKFGPILRIEITASVPLFPHYRTVA